MKRKLLLLVLSLLIIVIVFFSGYSILHPFEITSQGYTTTNKVDDHLKQATRTYVYKLQRLNSLPVSLVNVELTGYSGVTLGKINFDENNIKCDTTITDDSPVNPSMVILYCKIFGIEFQQIIKDAPWFSVSKVGFSTTLPSFGPILA